MCPLKTTLRTEDRQVNGRHGPIPVRDYLPDAEQPDAKPFAWIHGGSFVGGGLDQPESDAVAWAIASTGRRVLTVDYRLAPRFSRFRDPDLRKPGHRFPIPLDDVVDAVDEYASSHGRRIFLGGASAGACLAASAAMRLRDDGQSPVAGIVLVYGVYHPELPPLPESVQSRTSGIYRFIQMTPGLARRMNLNYAGSREALLRAFPGCGTLAGLPPTFLVDADRDSLRASGQLFASQLLAAGVQVRHVVICGSRHAFLNSPGKPLFREGIEVMVGAMANGITG